MNAGEWTKGEERVSTNTSCMSFLARVSRHRVSAISCAAARPESSHCVNGHIAPCTISSSLSHRRGGTLRLVPR